VTAAIVALGLWGGGLPALVGCTGGPRAEAGREREPRPELDLARTPEYDYEPPEPGSYRLPPLMPAGDGRVLDRDGTPRSLREVLAGRVSVVSFVYTRCADPSACPLATGVLRQIHEVSRRSPSLARGLQLVTFSFDPEHDDPETMDRFGRAANRLEGGAPWRFLTTSGPDELRQVLEAWGQRVDRRRDADDPFGPLQHNLRVFLVDRHGMVRNIYSTGLLDPRLVVTDVRTLLLEEPS